MEVSILIIILFLMIYVSYETYIKDNPYEVIKIEDIKIKEQFRKSGINKKKLRQKECFYIEFGYFEDRIILNENNYLLDGYSTYILALQNGIKEIEIIRDKNK